jgi:flagellar basal body P-ring formation protein FlgA
MKILSTACIAVCLAAAGALLRRTCLLTPAVLLMALCATPLVHAGEAGESQTALTEQVRTLTLNAARAAHAQQLSEGVHAPRIEIVVGALNPRLQLAPCRRVEPYLPTGTHLWGRTHIGLRCTEGVRRWNVYLPVTVKVYGTALVATAPLNAGATLQETDLTTAEFDIAEQPAPVITATALAVGRVLTRPVAAGHGLRTTDLKPRVWFAAGDTVRVLATGVGFSVAGSGQALTAGLEGQAARVRTDSGQVVIGMPVATRQIAIAL